MEAIANTGHSFEYWEVANNVFAPDQFAEAIQMSLESNDEITAYFTGFIPCPEATAVEIEGNYITADLNWQMEGDPLAYIIRYRPVGADEWESEATQDTTFVLQDLDFCTSYELEIQSVCDNTTSSTTIYYFDTSCTNDTDDLEPIAEVTAFPNPFQEGFTINLVLQDGGPLNWVLFDAQGRLIRQSIGEFYGAGQHRIQISDLSSLASGVYWLQLESGGDVRQLRLVKVN